MAEVIDGINFIAGPHYSNRSIRIGAIMQQRGKVSRTKPYSSRYNPLLDNQRVAGKMKIEEFIARGILINTPKKVISPSKIAKGVRRALTGK